MNGQGSGPTFAAIALASDNDPEVLGIAVALIFVQIVAGTLIGSWMGRGEGEEEAADDEAEGEPAASEPAEAQPA